MEFGMLLRLFDVVNLIFLVHSVFKGEDSTYMISLKKKLNIGLYSDIYRLISCKLSMMIETTKLFILI